MSQLEQILFNQRSLLGDDEEIEEDVLVILYKVGGRDYASPIEAVQEVLPNVDVTPYPMEQDGFTGIANVRGALIPVVSTGVDSESEPARLLVFDQERGLFGLPADEVRKIQVSPSDWKRTEKVGPSGLLRVDDRPVRVVDATFWRESS